MRHPLAILLGFGLAGIFFWSGSALSYPTYDDGGGTGCVQCHGGFTGGPSGQLHKLHVNNFVNNCNLCHPSGAGTTPVSTTSSGPLADGPGHGCRGCHGRSQDDVGSGFGTWGAGLRRVHATFGEASCATCHSNDPAGPLVAEDVLPPYYSYTNDTPLNDPCSEDFGGTRGGGPGLDNDGDGDTDGADSDCTIQTGVKEDPGKTPQRLTLLALSPNPVLGSGTNIRFGLPRTSDVSIGVYDVAGRPIVFEKLYGVAEGWQTFHFDGNDATGRRLSSGMYMVRIEAAGSVALGRIVLIR